MTAFLANANTKTTYLKSGTHHPPGGQKYMGWFFYEKQSPLLSRRVGVVTLIDTKLHFDSILSGDNSFTVWCQLLLQLTCKAEFCSLLTLFWPNQAAKAALELKNPCLRLKFHTMFECQRCQLTHQSCPPCYHTITPEM